MDFYALGNFGIGPRNSDRFFPNVKVMAHPLAGANVDRGVRVEIRCKHRKQRG